jgi:peroxiredoxin
VCKKKISNTATILAKLSQHFTNKYSHLSNKKTDYYKRLLDSQNKQFKVSDKKVTISEKAQEANNLVAELIAYKIKIHTTAGSIIMPVCKITVRKMICKGVESESNRVPVSDNTPNRQEDDTSHDTEDVLSKILKNTTSALQVDESTDTTNKAQPAVDVYTI